MVCVRDFFTDLIIFIGVQRISFEVEILFDTNKQKDGNGKPDLVWGESKQTANDQKI